MTTEQLLIIVAPLVLTQLAQLVVLVVNGRTVYGRLESIDRRLESIERQLGAHGERITRLEERTSPISR